MPDYKYRLKNGKTMTLSGDTQPPDSEVEALAKQNGVELMPADTESNISRSDVPAPKSETIDDVNMKMPTEDTPDDTPPEPTQERSLIGKLWDKANEPLTDLPSRFAQSISDYLTQPSSKSDDTFATRANGFIAGGMEGIGHLLSGATSPVNLATMLATAGESPLAKAGYNGLAGALRLGAKATGLPMAIHGGSQVMNPDLPLSQRAMGLAEIAGGIAGMHGMPESEASHPNIPNDPNVEFGANNPIRETGLARPKAKLSPGVEAATPIGKSSTDAANTFNVNAAEKAANDSNPDVIDPHAKYRAAPVGTSFTIDTGDMSRKKFNDLRDLGYQYQDINDQGKVVFKKTGESPQVKEFKPPPNKSNEILDALNAPRTLLASVDYSAPLRQGIGLIYKKAFWTSLDDMFKAGGSEAGYDAVQSSIRADPMFKKTVAADGTIKPSFAEQSGLKLTDLHGLSSREESMMSSLAEKFPGVRASNRAYTAYINKLRADSFSSLVSDFGAYGDNAQNNLPLAQELANYVNTASGRGSLGKLESSATVLSTILFSPRLIASRLNMMSKGAQAVFSPEVYMMSQPSVRRQYLKSLFAIAGVGGVVTGLGTLAGGTVEKDPASADFGKLKLGQTRIDPYAGFQQYIVAAQRLMPELDALGIPIGGKMKSTNTGIEYDLGNPKYGQSDRFNTLERFARSKVNPVGGFVWSLLKNRTELDGSKMNFTTPNPLDNSITQRLIPLVMQDIASLVREEGVTPKTATASALSTFGMGVQEYKKQRPH